MLQGRLVKLREFLREDAAPIRTLINDADVLYYVRPDTPYPFTEKDEEQFIDSNSALNSEYNFAIESLRSGQIIGSAGIRAVSWKNRSAEIGLFIGDKTLWGKGYGSDVVRLLLAFLFDEMNLHRVSLKVYSFNERAISSYRKCGFVEEGVLRETVYKRGEYHDTIVMGMLRSEYEALRAAQSDAEEESQ